MSVHVALISLLPVCCSSKCTEAICPRVVTLLPSPHFWNYLPPSDGSHLARITKPHKGHLPATPYFFIFIVFLSYLLSSDMIVLQWNNRMDPHCFKDSPVYVPIFEKTSEMTSLPWTLVIIFLKTLNLSRLKLIIN